MKLTLNELKYILLEASDKLLLEISNNAIETMIKTTNPELAPFFNQRMGDICALKDAEGNYNQMRGYLCPKIGINPDEGLACGDMKLKDWLRLNILREFHINRGNGPLRYLKGIVRICCSVGINLYNDIEINHGNQERFKMFKQLIAFMHSHNIDMDEDLNGMDFFQLKKEIYPLVRQEMIKKYAERQNVETVYNTDDYTVKEISIFKEASQYRRYTTWCVTQDDSHFRTYTSDGSQFFFCLKNGFENVPKEKGENCPLDEYGLSMVSVCVSPSGEPEFVTTRWNHDNDGENNKNLKTFEQIENVLGIPRSIFLENICPEITNEDVKYALENTNLPLDKIFRVVREDMPFDLTLVGNYDDEVCQMMYNILYDRELLSDEWYADFRRLDDGLIQVRTYDGRYNLFDEKGKVFPQNVNGCVETYNKQLGLYKVVFNRYGDTGINLVNRQGKKCLPENMTYIGLMNQGYAEVLNKKRLTNFIDSNCNLMWDEWKDICVKKDQGRSGFGNGIAVVDMLNDSFNYIDIKTGEFIMPESQYRCEPFANGYGRVKNTMGLFNLVDRSGKLLFDGWFRDLIALRDGWFSVRLKPDEGLAIMDRSGNILSDKRWKYIIFYDGRYGCVQEEESDGDEYIVINSKFEEVLRTRCMVCFSLPNDTFVVLKWEPSLSTNVMALDGSFLLPDGLKIDTFNQTHQFITFRDDNDVPIYKINNKTGEITEL